MTLHAVSPADLDFQRAFEAGEVSPAEFDHRAHLRLAYVYRCQGELAQAQHRMRKALRAFLAARGLPAAKFHETLTRAWVMAVSHFMDRAPSRTFAEFAANSTPLLDSRVMLTHYSRERLFSDAARAAFLAPDIEAIPA